MLDDRMTVEEFKEFTDELKKDGFPMCRLDFENRKMRLSNDIIFENKIHEYCKAELETDFLEKCTYEQIINAATDYVDTEVVIPKGEQEHTDKTYDMWISRFCYAAMFWKIICKEINLGHLD